MPDQFRLTAETLCDRITRESLRHGIDVRDGDAYCYCGIPAPESWDQHIAEALAAVFAPEVADLATRAEVAEAERDRYRIAWQSARSRAKKLRTVLPFHIDHATRLAKDRVIIRARIRKVHDPVKIDGGGYECDGCGVAWPCRTYTIVFSRLEDNEKTEEARYIDRIRASYEAARGSQNSPEGGDVDGA